MSSGYDVYQGAQTIETSKTDTAVVFIDPQRETRTIPIVFAIVSDPVGEGFVASLAHPAGNITGFHNSEASIAGKWLELLVEIAPGLKRAAMIFNPDTAPGHGKYYMPNFEAAARSSQVTPIPAAVRTIADVEAVIIDLGRKPGGGFVAMADFFLLNHRVQMIDAAAQNHVPAGPALSRDLAAAGLSRCPIARPRFRGRAPPPPRAGNGR